MKKAIWYIPLCVLLLLSLLSGCGGAHSGNAASAPESAAPSTEPKSSGWDNGSSESAAAEDSVEEPSPQSPAAIRANAKLILTAEISAETKSYSDADATIKDMTAQAGGYLESSSSSGHEGSRWAEYTVRIPQAAFEGFLSQLGNVCNVTSQNQTSEDIGQQYFDAESHVKTLRTKHERLLNLLAKSEKMEDIIALENALSDCEYELEQYETTLRRYDDLIGLSTVHITLSEVPGLTTVPAGNSFTSELKTAATAGTRGFTLFFRTLIIFLVAIWPVLLLLAIAGLIAYLVIKKRRHIQQDTSAPPKTDTKTTGDNHKQE